MKKEILEQLIADLDKQLSTYTYSLEKTKADLMAYQQKADNYKADVVKTRVQIDKLTIAAKHQVRAKHMIDCG